MTLIIEQEKQGLLDKEWKVEITVGKGKKKKKEVVSCKIRSIDRYGGFVYVEDVFTGKVFMTYLSALIDENGVDARTKLGYSLKLLSLGKNQKQKQIEYLESEDD